MDTTQEIGKHKEFIIRGAHAKTIIDPDNRHLLIEKDTITDIANIVSRGIGRAISEKECTEIIELIKRVKKERFFGKTYQWSVNNLAKSYLEKKNIKPKKSIQELAHLKDDGTTNDETLDQHEYAKAELMNMTPDEHQYKYTAHADRRGNAIIDKDRVEGNASSPNSVYPEMSKNQYYKLSSNTMRILNKFLDPHNIEELWKRPRSWNFSYDNITLPRRIVHLDSRNKLQNNTDQNELRWLMNFSGQPGRLGDVKVQDTLKEVIAMRINSFWIPVSNPIDDYYNKINLHMVVFAQQVYMSEFVGPTETTPVIRGYHFEFKVHRSRERLYLTPTIDTYKFSKPVAQVDQLSFMFKSPFRTIQIDPDRGYFTVTPGLTTVFTGSIPHLLNTGDLVYIMNFSSTSVSLDNQMNSEDGWIITRLNATQFEINLDTSTLVGPFTGILVYYGSKRILAEIEFISLEH